MYNLVLEPAKQSVDYNAAMRELYAHARHRGLKVRSLPDDGTGVARFELVDRFAGVVSRARIERDAL